MGLGSFFKKAIPMAIGGAIAGPIGAQIGGSLGSFISGAGDIIGGAMNAASPALSGYLAYQGQKEANEANLTSAREQMAFQERMSNTAYQRSRQDMIKAGLNPILAATAGGSSTPSGSMATVESTAAPALSSAIATKTMLANLENVKADTTKKVNESNLTKDQQRLVHQNIKNAMADEAVKHSEFLRNAASTKDLDASAFARLATARRDYEQAAQIHTETQYQKEMGQAMRTLGAGSSSGKAVADVLRGIFSKR